MKQALIIMRVLIYIFVLLFSFRNSFGNDSTGYTKSLTFKILAPLSLFEFDACLGTGVEYRLKRFGVESEYSRVFYLNSYGQSGPYYKSKVSGNRIRISLKYYLKRNDFAKQKANFQYYFSLMPMYKRVNYQMKWWLYDSISSGKVYTTRSDIPVTYNSTHIGCNLLFGDVFSFSFLNLEFYSGIGFKSVKLDYREPKPEIFEPYSRPSNNGLYFNYLMGLKIGFEKKCN